VSAWLLSLVLRRRPGLEKRLVGEPTLLVRDGTVLTNRLRRARVTSDELDEACRQHGITGPGDAALAVLEVDGSISVVPQGPDIQRTTPHGRRRRRR
jgi:uncharacterized membrane protein YcaP (DUF421 family)